jgi:mono/diheme cytochrome c family protein
MQHVTVSAKLQRGRCAIRVIATAATLISWCVDPSRAGAQDQPSSTPGNGRIWYEQYCTPCHGPGGAPGSAVFAASKQPVDLRTYVQRHGGKFPSGDWLMVVFAQPINNPHTAVWERIRREEADGTTNELASRAKVRSIAEYVISIQAK